jgi:hypothetical protein
MDIQEISTFLSPEESYDNHPHMYHFLLLWKNNLIDSIAEWLYGLITINVTLNSKGNK